MHVCASKVKMKNYRRFRNKLILFLLNFLLIINNGCWDARDLNNMAIISAVGIDLDEKQSGKVIVTIQVIKPGEAKSASGGGDTGGAGAAPVQRKAYVTVSSSGKTVSEAFQNFVNQVDRELYLSENQIIIFSKTTAQKGLYPLLEFFIRTRQPRGTSWILIAAGKAGSVMETSLGLEKIPSIEITRLILNRESASQTDTATQHEFICKLLAKTSSAHTSLIQVKKQPGQKKISLAGTAVFKEDRLVGKFDKIETRGLLWILNKVGKGVIRVKSPAWGNIDLEIIKAKSKLIPEIKDGKIVIKLMIDTEYGLTNVVGTPDFTKQGTAGSLDLLIRKAIRREVSAALTKAFQLKADVFGFGEIIHQRYPKEWKRLKPVWDQAFLTTEVNVRVRTQLKSVGLTIKPIFKIENNRGFP